jgi:predicted transcriptional regulator
MIALVAETMAIALTPRQQAVAHLYYLESKTQIEIGQVLGLSQTTISRHIMGQKKDGKMVGGAIQKIRKTIQKEAYKYHRRTPTRRSELLRALSLMLDAEAKRSEIAHLLGELIRGSCAN